MNLHIPSELKIYEDDLHFFFDLMVRKLHMNRHKGFVEGKSIQTFLQRLRDEIEELESAIVNESQFAVALECSDTANQAFLLALCCLLQSKDEYTKERDRIYGKNRA